MLPTPILADGLMTIDWASDLWILIVFSVMAIILYKTAWKNVLAGLKAREDRIRGDIARAEEAQAKGEATLREYAAQLAQAEDKVRDILNKATAEAHKIAENINAAAQAEAEARKEKATAEIEQAKHEALRQIYDQTAELATSIASRIIKRNLNPADQQNLVNEALDQLQKVG
jgi:F-type H+-transporting ATPase subunit b